MRKGIACICLSAFGFASMAVFVRLADSFGEPLGAVQKSFFRNIISMAVAAAVFLRSRRRGPVFPEGTSRRGWLLLIARSVFGTLGIFANFHAVSKIPLGDAMALNKTAPFFTLVACWAFLGERISAKQASAVAAAFAGALLVVKPNFALEGFSDAAVGLAGGAFAGAAYALLHALGRSGTNSAFIVLFFSAFSTLASAPFVVLGGFPASPAQIAVLTGAGAAAALGQFAITWAYKFAQPRQIAVYDYCGIAFAAVMGYFAFGHVPDISSVAGIAVIVVMAVVVFRGRI